MARATVQKAAIADAITDAQAALGMVELGASDADITAAEEAIQAITTAIEAAADVDDTSMYSAQATLLDNSLAAATGFVHQDRAAKKMARADMQQGAIAAAIAEAEAAVANVDGATDEEIEAAAMAAGGKVQAVREAIAAAVDVDDTSMYTTQVAGLEASLGTATDMAKSAYQTGAIMAALLTANSAVDVVALGATDEEIEVAATAVQAAKAAIAKAVDVDDTSLYTAQVDGLETSLTKATELVQQDRDAMMIARAVMQQYDIAAAIADAEVAVALVVDGASDEVIAAAEKAVQDARVAIAAAVDVDDTSMDTATVNGIASGLIATKIAVLTSRAAQETIDTQLAEQRTMATAAMDAAKIAADNASMAADDADTARTNIATMQTNENSGMHARAARDNADTAMAAYMDAKAASEAADEALTVAAAVEARLGAQGAQKSAEENAAMAGENKGSAEESVVGALFIDGTVKTVGGTTVDATAKARRETDDDQTTITGLIKSDNPMRLGVGAVAGQEVVVENESTDEIDARYYKQAVAERDVTIGKTVDSSDDMARLMLVTHYAGSKSVRVYADSNVTVDVTGTMRGKVVIGDVTYSLKKVGTYYQAGGGTNQDGDRADGDGLDHDEPIGAKADGETVYSYTVVNVDAADMTSYVVLRGEVTTTVSGEDPETEYTYQDVEITASSLLDEDNMIVVGPVTARIPDATEYDHIHFGVWAGLNDAKDDGSQTIADLGIGFVQNYDGSGETDNVPLQGECRPTTATGLLRYRRRTRTEMATSRCVTVPRSLDVSFEEDKVEIILTDLATFKGDIAGSTFSNEDATATDIERDALP